MDRKKPSTASAPQKLYRSIREVSDLLAVKPHVLRYWETQFPVLRPKKNRAGNRIYRPTEVELLERIKSLLYEQRFTIEGARRLLEDERKKPGARIAVSGSAIADEVALASGVPREMAAVAFADSGAPTGDALAAASAQIAGLRAALAEAERSLEEARSQLAARAARDLDRVEALAELRHEMQSALRTLRGDVLAHDAVARTDDEHAAAASPATSPSSAVHARAEDENAPSMAGETLLPATGFA